jgi:hypothetical protein
MRPLHKYAYFEPASFARDLDLVLHRELYYRTSVKADGGGLEVEVAQDALWQRMSVPVAIFRWRRNVSHFVEDPPFSFGTRFRGSAVFGYDYAAMREAMRPLREELLRVAMHPRNALRLCL